MGRMDPDRRQAIAASMLAEMPCLEEAVIESSNESYGEEAVEIELDYAAYAEANQIYLQLKMRDETPASWWREQQNTEYNRRIYLALDELWDAREEPLDNNHLDEWSGPAMPMSAVDNFGVERDGNDSSAEKLLRNILHGKPDEPKCPNCGLTEIGCALAGCNVNVNANAIDDTTQIS